MKLEISQIAIICFVVLGAASGSGCANNSSGTTTPGAAAPAAPANMPAAEKAYIEHMKATHGGPPPKSGT
jgi:hypothetical protein